MAGRIRAFIESAETATTPDALFRLFDTYVRHFGIDVCCYHITSKQLRAVSVGDSQIYETLPGKLFEKYANSGIGDVDPVTAEARHAVEPFHWFDVADRIRLSPEQHQFLKELRAAGLVDGIAVPIFGPLGTIAFFGLGSMHRPISLPHDDLLELQLVCQLTHNLYIEMTNNLHTQTLSRPLSRREKEVLTLVATGLSNVAISDRLGITENTIDTILRRTFAKLGVNNRITAVLKGIGAGLILPEEA
jgi:DNA-binding CsgD family transcriptional regulator